MLCSKARARASALLEGRPLFLGAATAKAPKSTISPQSLAEELEELLAAEAEVLLADDADEEDSAHAPSEPELASSIKATTHALADVALLPPTTNWTKTATGRLLIVFCVRTSMVLGAVEC